MPIRVVTGMMCMVWERERAVAVLKWASQDSPRQSLSCLSNTLYSSASSQITASSSSSCILDYWIYQAAQFFLFHFGAAVSCIRLETLSPIVASGCHAIRSSLLRILGVPVWAGGHWEHTIGFCTPVSWGESLPGLSSSHCASATLLVSWSTSPVGDFPGWALASWVQKLGNIHYLVKRGDCVDSGNRDRSVCSDIQIDHFKLGSKQE